MILKVASTSEYEDLTQVFLEVYNSVKNKAQFNWPLESIQVELLASQFVICVDSSQQLCGFISYRESDEQIEIMALGTRPHQRGSQVMSSLLVYLQDYSRKASKALLLEVHQENASAIGLYVKCGFKQIGVRKRYYSDGADALTYQYSV